jgi:Fanconi anemia group J protein
MNDRPQDPTSLYFINGYTVYFPDGRKPFPAQLSVISKVLQALKEKKNALLESPTGTGKVGIKRFI